MSRHRFLVHGRCARIARTSLLALALGACGQVSVKTDAGVTDRGGSPSKNDRPIVPGTTVQLGLASADADKLASLNSDLTRVKTLSAAQLLAAHKPAQVAELGYDPSTAQGLDLIQKSAFGLDANELSILKERGFVVSATTQFPTMLYGYDTIYAADLPLYVSADSLLDAVHTSYDRMLAEVEETGLRPELTRLLAGMRSELAARTDENKAALADADFYLAVGASLLSGTGGAPVAGASQTEIDTFVQKATAATGDEVRTIFGVSRMLDFSQFEPRGHYTRSPELERYFRAMMWFGRIELRMIEAQSDGSQVFHRDQLEAAVLLRALMSDDDRARWQRIDDTVQGFVGESDSMRAPQVDALLHDLQVDDLAGLAAVSDQRLAQAIIDGGYGAQQIASQLIVNGIGGTLPLDRSFALFGQRYTPDAHVLSNVVFDRVVHDGAPPRLMPSPLDAAYAAFGNDRAAQLLKPELEKYRYAGELEAMRVLIDAHGDAYWGENLYTRWIGALRALSPSASDGDPKASGLPALAGTEAWGRRLLNTQLGSWAELRHDTILYAKQGYTSGIACSFPDAYVDPYPEFYAALVSFAERGAALADGLADGYAPALAQHMRLYFDHVRASFSMLQGMAEAERNGMPFTAEQMDFINQAVRRDPVMPCGSPPIYNGWYAELIYGVSDSGAIALGFDPVIADVHTQYTDQAGNDVGRVLHVGTGYARAMVVTSDACDGVRAYAGLAFSYYEKITEHYDRLNDEAWSETLADGPQNDVPWTEPFVSGGKY